MVIQTLELFALDLDFEKDSDWLNLDLDLMSVGTLGPWCQYMLHKCACPLACIVLMFCQRSGTTVAIWPHVVMTLLTSWTYVLARQLHFLEPSSSWPCNAGPAYIGLGHQCCLLRAGEYCMFCKDVVPSPKHVWPVGVVMPPCPRPL